MKLAKDEIIFHELKPENKLIVIWLFTKCLTHGTALAFIYFFICYTYTIVISKNSDIIFYEFKFYLLVCVLLTILGTTLSYIYHRFLLKTISYLITDKRCLYKGGIFKKIEHNVAYHKITDVERTQNLVEQILGLSTINLFTPGTASVVGFGAKAKTMPELRFEGLAVSDEQAETINDQVRKYGNL